MKKYINYFIYFTACLFLLSGCVWLADGFRETRTELIGTNIIGIVGEPSTEEYIEIIYSVADEENPGYNKTVSRMVSPPYIFQNDRVYMTYEYIERIDATGPFDYTKELLRDFEEGGAEYLRIINHSLDKQVEFFFVDTYINLRDEYPIIPEIRYKNAPVYFLLYPERKPAGNIHFDNSYVIYFEGDHIGDLTVTEAWSEDNVAALYREEYARANNAELMFTVHRIIDIAEGMIDGLEYYFGNIFYGIIEPEKELHGNEKTWLLATPGMFNGRLEAGSLR
jgi:hypothetical protein